MKSNVEQNQAHEQDQRDVARRLFKALCALYPDCYIALVESQEVASGRPLALELPSVDARLFRGDPPP